MSFCGATEAPVFGLPVTSPLGQSQSGQPYLHLWEVYVMYVP